MSEQKKRPGVASARAVMPVRPLASLTGIGFVVGFLVGTGAMCPKCGHGTRVTSQRWAKCKQCGKRIARVSPDAAEAALLAAGGATP